MKKYKDSILYILVVVIAIVLCLVKLYPEVLSIYHIENGMYQKKQELTDLDRQLATLKNAQIKSDEETAMFQKKIYNPQESGLDPEASFSIMFDDLIEMAKTNSVKIYSIAYNYNPADDNFVKNGGGQFSVCQVNMQMIADYIGFNSFLQSIYKYPYLINIDEIELKPYTRNKRILLINVQLKLYATGSSGGKTSVAPAKQAGTTPGSNPASPASPAAAPNAGQPAGANPPATPAGSAK